MEPPDDKLPAFGEALTQQHPTANGDFARSVLGAPPSEDALRREVRQAAAEGAQVIQTAQRIADIGGLIRENLMRIARRNAEQGKSEE